MFRKPLDSYNGSDGLPYFITDADVRTLQERIASISRSSGRECGLTVPKRRTPLAYITAAELGTAEALAEENPGMTYADLYRALNFEDSLKWVCAYYIHRGYADVWVLHDKLLDPSYLVGLAPNSGYASLDKRIREANQKAAAAA